MLYITRDGLKTFVDCRFDEEGIVAVYDAITQEEIDVDQEELLELEEQASVERQQQLESDAWDAVGSEW